MTVFGTVGALLLILVVLWDGFETIVLPHRVSQSLRLTRLFYLSTWRPWAALARRLPSGRQRENYLSFYGPLSLLLLLGVWVAGLIVGFALLQWTLDPALNAPEGPPTFGTALYLSGTTFFTLGLGDVTPRTPFARVITVVESGTGFGFLALVMGYLPVLYQAFSRREVHISLLDARAGTPPSVGALLHRTRSDDPARLTHFLHDWERWSAELLESHLSYPVLGYFRSQHENQSWVAALTMVLDTCALAMVATDGPVGHQAQFTFAMARHAAVDLAQVFHTPPCPPMLERLPSADLRQLWGTLAVAGVPLRETPTGDQQLAELRRLYEPYVNALANHLLMALPPWLPVADGSDNWQTTAWEVAGAGQDWDKIVR